MVDDYIRRQEMIDAVDHLHIIPSIYGTGKPIPSEDFRVQFIGTVLKVKSADVVPVVRCKDCKYWNDGNVLMGCYWDIDGGQPQEMDFCSRGKRREE